MDGMATTREMMMDRNTLEDVGRVRCRVSMAGDVMVGLVLLSIQAVVITTR